MEPVHATIISYSATGTVHALASAATVLTRGRLTNGAHR
ncbi:hypothetical protein JOD67_005163 [Tenggerimyces flavus]|nr:hypothetical protein [Tenggerimyces flavus]